MPKELLNLLNHNIGAFYSKYRVLGNVTPQFKYIVSITGYYHWITIQAPTLKPSSRVE